MPEISLHVLNANITEYRLLSLCFDTFCHDIDFQSITNIDDTTCHFAGGAVGC